MRTEPGNVTPLRGERQASAREFLAVVFRRKWIILGLFAVSTVTVLAITLFTPTSYRSIGKVLVSRGERESLMYPQRRMVSWEEELASEVQFIQSHPVALRAQQLLDDEAKRGGRRIVLNTGQVDAEVVGASNAVLVAYVDRDANVAQAACDALIRAYVETRNETFDIKYPAEFFSGETRQVADELERLERQRRDYVEGTHAVALEDQQRVNVNYLNTLDQRRNEILSELAAANAQKRQLEGFANDPTAEPPSTGDAGDQVLNDIRMRVSQQEARVAQLKERYRDDSPDVLNATATLEALRALARKEVASRADMVQTRIEMLEAKRKPIENEIARVRGEQSAIPEKAMSIAEMDRRIALLQDRYAELVKMGDQARVTEQTSKTVTVLVLTPAGPGRPTNTRDYVRLALAPAFSLVVGLGLAFFIDGLDTRVRTPGDAETATDLPVLASLTEHRRRREGSGPEEEAAAR